MPVESAEACVLEAEITGLLRRQADQDRHWATLQRQRADLDRQFDAALQGVYETAVALAGKQLALAELRGDHAGAAAARAVLARHAQTKCRAEARGTVQ
jgi:hypothetical protein